MIDTNKIISTYYIIAAAEASANLVYLTVLDLEQEKVMET